ncbi:DUF3310 domain-containing protein [bacterium]|nr:DUF3310 domain-containing protein [bacterium]
MNATDTQVGGSHYKDMPIQPVEYIHKNNLSYLEGNVIKYITRHRSKGGKADVEKALHYCQLILQLVYGEANEPVVITVPEPPKPKRGRPPGAKNKKKKAK